MMCSEDVYRSDKGEGDEDGRTNVGDGNDVGGIREGEYRLQQHSFQFERRSDGHAMAMK